MLCTSEPGDLPERSVVDLSATPRRYALERPASGRLFPRTHWSSTTAGRPGPEPAEASVMRPTCVLYAARPANLLNQHHEAARGFPGSADVRTGVTTDDGGCRADGRSGVARDAARLRCGRRGRDHGIPVLAAPTSRPDVSIASILQLTTSPPSCNRGRCQLQRRLSELVQGGDDQGSVRGRPAWSATSSPSAGRRRLVLQESWRALRS